MSDLPATPPTYQRDHQNSGQSLFFGGELRGYNVVASNSGGNCVDLEHSSNPYRFYGLVASGCNNGIGINMYKSRAAEFHGVSAFGNTIDVSLSGYTDTGAYVLFDGAQFGHSIKENMYLDQHNEPLICAANCYFNNAWEGPCLTNQSCAAIEIGPDAKNIATQQTPVIAQFNQGLFASSPAYDVYFDTNPTTGKPCKCRVALGGGMIDVATQGGNPGQPTTNNTTLLAGETTYTPPVFANAASVGVPLTLNPNELGIGVSTDTEIAPGKGGLKLSVQCHTPHNGTVKLVALAGPTDTTGVTVADSIGSAVTACQ